jgi:uncharacterized protein YacL
MTNDPAPVNRGDDPRWRVSPTKIVVGLILLAGIVVPLLVGTYAKVEPRLFGFPFFYWYQLLWVFIAAGLCALSYVLLKRERATFARRRQDDTATGTRTGSDRNEGGSR